MKTQSNLARERQFNFLRSDAASDLQRLDDSLFVFSKAHSEWVDTDTAAMNAIIEQISSGKAWREVVENHMLSVGDDWLRRLVLSPSRGLFLNLLDLSGNEVALDLGSGWGSVTRELAERVESVISVEPNLERLRVNHAIGSQERLDNVCYLQANAFQLPINSESLDLAVLCGVFEWLGFDANDDVGAAQRKGLDNISKLIRPGGKILVAIENRTGLKYILGERDDHSDTRNISYLPFAEAEATFLEQCNNKLRARTYDYYEYQDLLRSAGYRDIEVHLAFPDYKLPQVLVPATATKALKRFVDNAGLPADHDGHNGVVCAQAARLGGIYRALNNLEVLHAFAPSFVIIATKE